MSLACSTIVDWKRIYSLDTFRAKGAPPIPEHILHIKIAAEENDDTLFPLLKDPRAARYLTTKSQLSGGHTPLMIAAAMGRVNLVRIMVRQLKSSKDIDFKQYLNATDDRNWTALHFAALKSEDVYRTLVTAGANQHIETNLFGRACDFKEMTLKEAGIAKSAQRVWIHLPGKKKTKLSQVSLRELAAATGIEQYRDFPFFKKLEDMQVLRKKPPEEAPQVRHLLRRLLPQTREPFPLLEVVREEGLGESTRSFALCAGELIPAERVCAVYSGEWNVAAEQVVGDLKEEILKGPMKAYKFGSLDALRMGSASRWANYAWPNSFMLHMPIRGVSLPVLVSGEEIPAGEAIQWCYGIQDWGLTLNTPQRLYQKEAMCRFFEGGLRATVQRLYSQPSREPLASVLLDEERVKFPIETPMAMLYLHYTGIIHVNEVLEMVTSLSQESEAASEPYFYAWAQHRATAVWVIRTIAYKVQEFEEKMDVHPQLRAWMLDQLENRSVIQILKGMEYISKQLVLDVLDIDEIIQQASIQLDNYVLEEDAAYPFCIDSLADTLLKTIRSLGGDNLLIFNKLYRQVQLEVEKGHAAHDTIIPQMFQVASEKISSDPGDEWVVL